MTTPDSGARPDWEALRETARAELAGGRFRFQVASLLVERHGLPAPEAEALCDDVAARLAEEAAGARDRADAGWRPSRLAWLRANWIPALIIGLVLALAAFVLFGGVRWIAASGRWR